MVGYFQNRFVVVEVSYFMQVFNTLVTFFSSEGFCNQSLIREEVFKPSSGLDGIPHHFIAVGTLCVTHTVFRNLKHRA
jgi:hypothetical protein